MAGCGAILLMLLGGCVTVSAPVVRPGADDTTLQCAERLAAVDGAIDRVGVRDAQAHPVDGAPYLRADRFTASLRERAHGGEQPFAAWIRRMRAAGDGARRAEIDNLPDAELAALGADRETLRRQIDACGDRLQQWDLSNSDRRDKIAAAATVPDAYATWQRALGLYALSRIPFASGVERWQDEVVAGFGNARAGTPTAYAVTRHGPAIDTVATRERMGRLLASASLDPLGVPQFSGAQALELLDAYAPVFEVETSGVWDRIGYPVWRASGVPDVDVSRITVFRRIAFTRYRDHVLVQLVYTIWFSERPADAGVDLLAGRLDGLVWRVTLTPDGAPWVYDSMHPCGCFHLFFPTPRAAAIEAPEPGEEWAFMPAAAPDLADGERIRLRLATRTHYLVDVGTHRAGDAVPYQVADDDELRSLPAPDGTRRSLYGPDGLVSGTERDERFLFWPMGIPSAGAMRQWGHHATAFVGRRHFDDAHLFDRRFRLVP